MPARKPKVLVAMSGGVDSSVAAALLLREGYDVVGCFMRLGSPGESLEGLQRDDAQESCDPRKLRIGHQGCCSINDAADARTVAARLGIPFYVCNFKRDFNRVIEYFVGEYNAGRTPNPCIRCNDWLKFGKLFEYARAIEAEFIATGHYARVIATDDLNKPRPSGSGFRLLRGLDDSKDQSYVLFGTPREHLARMLLPIGSLEKPRVRELAREFDLPVFDKPDSQEICFVPDQDYAALVAKRSPESIKPGSILDREGNTVGEHQGHQHFTIGQRKGVGLALGYPVYVVNKNAETNTITLGSKGDLFSTSCTATQTNWLMDEGDSGPGAWHSELSPCTAKIRYNALPTKARVRMVRPPSDRRGDGGEIEVVFDEPQPAVAPGQAVVCYDEHDAVICGGWINAASPAGASEARLSCE